MMRIRDGKKRKSILLIISLIAVLTYVVYVCTVLNPNYKQESRLVLKKINGETLYVFYEKGGTRKRVI